MKIATSTLYPEVKNSDNFSVSLIWSPRSTAVTFKTCFSLMPSDPRDDQHWATSWRLFSQTGHHGHVNNSPA